MKRAVLSIVMFSVVSVISLGLVSCSEDDPTATVTINSTGSDFGGDVTGDGGSTTQNYTWSNSQATVEYNMDITAAVGGTFNLTIQDADGTNVLNETLQKGVGDDSKSGVSSAGTAGDWTVIITLTSFSGDGSFSLSPGN